MYEINATDASAKKRRKYCEFNYLKGKPIKGSVSRPLINFCKTPIKKELQRRLNENQFSHLPPVVLNTTGSGDNGRTC